MDQRMTWWRNAKIGMFIHWGPYSAFWKSGRTGDPGFAVEWARHALRIPREEYHALARDWNPYKFDANKVVELAKDAGMGYMIFTSKHHDGFCMFDSNLTDFKITKSRLGRDVARELSDACASQGVPLGFYYSPRDWDHPDYLPHYDYAGNPSPRYGGWWGHWPNLLVDAELYRRKNGKFEAGDFLDCGCSGCKANRPILEERDPAKAEFKRYIKYEKDQIQELLGHYKDVKVLWFDGQEHCAEAAELNDFLAEIRGAKPDVIVNDRIGVSADFGIAESYIPETGETRDWEACLTLPYSWGYEPDAHSFFSPTDIIHQVVDVVSKGGNILINISPDEMGSIPEYQEERLRILGRWLHRFGDAIYSTRCAPVSPQKGLYFTAKGADLYIIQTGDVGRDIWVPLLTLDPNAKVELLGANRDIRWEQSNLLALSTRRDDCKAPSTWPGSANNGLHLRVGEIPAILWYGEPALAFKITGTWSYRKEA
jgi:alpha-L-fucosidase